MRAFKGKNPIRTRQVIDKNIIEQVKKFSSLEYTISQIKQAGTQRKIKKFSQACRTVYRTLNEKKSTKKIQWYFMKPRSSLYECKTSLYES